MSDFTDFLYRAFYGSDENDNSESDGMSSTSSTSSTSSSRSNSIDNGSDSEEDTFDVHDYDVQKLQKLEPDYAPKSERKFEENVGKGFDLQSSPSGSPNSPDSDDSNDDDKGGVIGEDEISEILNDPLKSKDTLTRADQYLSSYDIVLYNCLNSEIER